MRTIVDHWVQIVDVTSVIEGTLWDLGPWAFKIRAHESIVRHAFWRLGMFVAAGSRELGFAHVSRFILLCHA
jgi:hypothetical protein